MSRRPATRFQPLILAAFSAVVFTGCGGSSREAPAPPPIAVSKAAARPKATDERPPAEPAPAPPDESTATIRTEDAAVPVDPNAKPMAKPVDALQWMRDGEARKADYARRLQEVQLAADAAAKSVAERESILLAFKNPYRPRPQLNSQDAQAVEGMGGAARVHWAEDRLAEANAALDVATKKLEAVKANPPLN